jgi:hypothetical protein
LTSGWVVLAKQNDKRHMLSSFELRKQLGLYFGEKLGTDAGISEFASDFHTLEKKFIIAVPPAATTYMSVSFTRPLWSLEEFVFRFASTMANMRSTQKTG